MRPALSRHARALSRGVISQQMVGAGVCEWTSPDRTRAFIWWKSPDEWANELHKYALRTGEAEVVETVAYFESEAGSPVLGMQEEVILRICQTVPFPFFLLDTPVNSRLCRASSTHVICSWSARTGQSSSLQTRVSLACAPSLQPLALTRMQCRRNWYSILRSVATANDNRTSFNTRRVHRVLTKRLLANIEKKRGN
jgi:hypothetical protein